MIKIKNIGSFKEGNFQRAMNKMQIEDSEGGGGGGGDGGGSSAGMKRSYSKNSRKSKTDSEKTTGKSLEKLIRMIMEREFDPCIVFAFSKRDVEASAQGLSKLDFCDEDEKKMIARIFNNAIETFNKILYFFFFEFFQSIFLGFFVCLIDFFLLHFCEMFFPL